MFYALALILSVSLRLVSHPNNFTPVGAASIFAGRTLPLPAAIALTWLGMLLGNVGLSRLHGYPLVDAVTPFVFAGFGLQVILAHALRRVRGGAFASVMGGGVTFFVLSNLGVFLTGGMYPHNALGLADCYAAALPFLRNQLIGDLLFTAALLPVYRWASRREARAASAPAALPGSSGALIAA